MALLLLPLLPLLVLVLSPASTNADSLSQICTGGNYTHNSTYKSNLNLLLSSLSSSNSTFFTEQKGSVPDRVYGLILCRGDVNISDCAQCVKNAAQDVLTLCPRSKQATIWYDSCQLRYADLSFFSTLNNDRVVILINTKNATNPERFIKTETALLDEVVQLVAAKNSSATMFATAVADNSSDPQWQKLYAMAQCTRDLPPDGCGRCLGELRSYYKKEYALMEGGRVLGRSCNFRYESYTFFAGKPSVSLDLSAQKKQPPPAPPAYVGGDDKETKNTTRNILLLVIASVIGGVLAVLFFCACLRKRISAKNTRGVAALGKIPDAENLLIGLPLLKVATDNFADSRKLGQGGFGTVYKGTLPNGEDIAVKRLAASSKQGIEELKNELILVAKLRHKNLVQLRGVCLQEEEKLLVYEYVPNGSLDNFLFDPVLCKQLNWEMRFKIIQGIARGLLYLQEECHLKVIHRDLKASNVLLDKDMTPKISDFGMARLFGEDETQHLTSRVVGTFGYMAPEYVRRGYFSMKSDVYSFGIMVLEIVTGKRNTSFKYDSEMSQDILSYTWEQWTSKRPLEVLDPSIGEVYSIDEVMRCIEIGLLCAQEAPSDRPPMSSVHLMLLGHSIDLQEPHHSSSTTPPRRSDFTPNDELAQTLNSSEVQRPLMRGSKTEEIKIEAKRVERFSSF